MLMEGFTCVPGRPRFSLCPTGASNSPVTSCMLPPASTTRGSSSQATTPPSMLLSVIAVAVKLSVNLNTPMPHHQQLAKLNSSVLIRTTMGNSMPSPGAMENKDLLSNVIALAILVITSMMNICMQLGTAVIYKYWREHGFVMFLMLLLPVKDIFIKRLIDFVQRVLFQSNSLCCHHNNSHNKAI